MGEVVLDRRGALAQQRRELEREGGRVFDEIGAGGDVVGGLRDGEHDAVSIDDRSARGRDRDRRRVLAVGRARERTGAKRRQLERPGGRHRQKQGESAEQGADSALAERQA